MNVKYVVKSSAVALVLLCQSARSGSTEGPKAMSLLRNGSFENVNPDTGTPEEWVAGDWSPAADRKPIRLLADTEDAPHGKVVARIVSENSGGNLIARQDLKQPRAGTYLLTVLVRPDHGANAYASLVGITDGKNVVYQSSRKVAAADRWTPLELTCRIPPDTGLLRILLRTNRGASFDQASLERLAENDSRNEPSNAQALATKRDELTYDEAFDRQRKADMTADELAWETVLEENLGSFYLPRYKLAKEGGRETAWDYVTDDPDLPRVLLIGDSISRGYTVSTRRALAGKVNVHRAPANCGPTTAGLKKLDVWLGNGDWDLIHFNFGIHDRNSDTEDYAKRLETIVERLRETGAALVFATSTPLPKDSDTYPHGACARLNEAAVEVMRRHHVPVNDLYEAILPHLGDYQNPGDCHFNGDGYTFLGNLVAKTILTNLEERNQ